MDDLLYETEVLIVTSPQLSDRALVRTIATWFQSRHGPARRTLIEFVREIRRVHPLHAPAFHY